MRYSALAMLPLAAASPFKVATIHNDAAPVLSSTNAGDIIPDSYMVVFKKHVKQKDARSHHEWVQSVHVKAQDERSELRKRSQLPMTTELFDGLKHTYDIVGGMMGYSGHFDEETLEEIRRHPDVSTLFPRLRAPRVANRDRQQPTRRLLCHRSAATPGGRFTCYLPSSPSSSSRARNSTPSHVIPCLGALHLRIHANVCSCDRSTISRRTPSSTR